MKSLKEKLIFYSTFDKCKVNLILDIKLGIKCFYSTFDKCKGTITYNRTLNSNCVSIQHLINVKVNPAIISGMPKIVSIQHLINVKKCQHIGITTEKIGFYSTFDKCKVGNFPNCSCIL